MSDPVLNLRPELVKRLHMRAVQIHGDLQAGVVLQVRFHLGRVLTYPYPAHRGYGTRGELIAVYSAGAAQEWIESDLIEFLSDTLMFAHP